MQTNAAEVVIREIETSELESILPMIGRLNSTVAPELLAERLETMKQHNYRCIGAFVAGQIVGIAGFWTGCRFWCGKYIDADNVVVEDSYRNLGIGARLMAWIHEEGRRLGCDCAVLDSYLSFTDAHRFYERLGYKKPGYHFKKEL